MNSFRRIVIAVDNSAFAESLARNGLEFVKRLKAEAAIISVTDTRSLLGTEGLSVSEAITLQKNSATENLNIVIKKVFGDYPVIRYILEGDPCQEILAFVNEWSADMIIIGTHGRKGISRILLGSVAEMVLRHSHVPVIIIPVNHE
jgi:nucleotide-binding universal stress UspA family protein